MPADVEVSNDTKERLQRVRDAGESFDAVIANMLDREERRLRDQLERARSEDTVSLDELKARHGLE